MQPALGCRGPLQRQAHDPVHVIDRDNTRAASNLSTLISAEQIRERVAQMGREIDASYGDDPIYLISVLKGSFMFLADLSRAIQHRVRIEFMGISSYGNAKTSSGQVKVTRDLDANIEGRDVLVVEDIIDSG